MEVVKKRLNQMKEDFETSQEKIVEFEAKLQDSCRNLEAAVTEKESLVRRIEAVESQIINANRTRDEVMEQYRTLERNVNENEGKRRFLESKELQGDITIGRLEERLVEIRDKFFENSVKCEEGDRRLAVLRADYDKVHAMRLQMQDRASHLLREYDEKTLRLRDLEDTLQRTGAKEYDEDANMKVIQDMHRDALYREETSRLYVQKLKRLIEIKQDEIEEVRRRKKKTEVEFRNTVEAVLIN